LLFPRDRVGGARALGQHRDQRWQRLQPRVTILVAVRARRAMQNRARDLKAAIDGGRADTSGDALRDERRQRSVMHLVRLQIANVVGEQPHMDADCFQAAHVLRLR
jgi:hypothetical protein